MNAQPEPATAWVVIADADGNTLGGYELGGNLKLEWRIDYEQEPLPPFDPFVIRSSVPQRCTVTLVADKMVAVHMTPPDGGWRPQPQAGPDDSPPVTLVHTLPGSRDGGEPVAPPGEGGDGIGARRVAVDEVATPDGTVVTVSTVRLVGPPFPVGLPYETLLTAASGPVPDGRMWWGDRASAAAGHAAVCGIVATVGLPAIGGCDWEPEDGED